MQVLAEAKIPGRRGGGGGYKPSGRKPAAAAAAWLRPEPSTSGSGSSGSSPRKTHGEAAAHARGDGGYAWRGVAGDSGARVQRYEQPRAPKPRILSPDYEWGDADADEDGDGRGRALARGQRSGACVPHVERPPTHFTNCAPWTALC